MSDGPLFQNADEMERIYAPEDVPNANMPEHERDVGGTAGLDTFRDNEQPSGGPVVTIASNPTGSAAVPNIGHDEHGGAPGDPETQAEYPIGDNHPRV
jgi:hypothetical protein